MSSQTNFVELKVGVGENPEEAGVREPSGEAIEIREDSLAVEENTLQVSSESGDLTLS